GRGEPEAGRDDRGKRIGKEEREQERSARKPENAVRITSARPVFSNADPFCGRSRCSRLPPCWLHSRIKPPRHPLAVTIPGELQPVVQSEGAVVTDLGLDRNDART